MKSDETMESAGPTTWLSMRAKIALCWGAVILLWGLGGGESRNDPSLLPALVLLGSRMFIPWGSATLRNRAQHALVMLLVCILAGLGPISFGTVAELVGGVTAFVFLVTIVQSDVSVYRCNGRMIAADTDSEIEAVRLRYLKGLLIGFAMSVGFTFWVASQAVNRTYAEMDGRNVPFSMIEAVFTWPVAFLAHLFPPQETESGRVGINITLFVWTLILGLPLGLIWPRSKPKSALKIEAEP